MRITVARVLAFAVSAGAALLAHPALCGPIAGQIDTFSGSLDAWSVGAAASSPPVDIATGGPAGAGDAFMEIFADGSGASGRLTVLNRAQWSGDYNAAGVNEIDMDLRNPGTTPLLIRLGFKQGVNQGDPGYSSTVAFALAADNAWHHAQFLIDAAHLTAVGGPLPLNTVLANVAELRILDNPLPELNGIPITAQLGIDNVTGVHRAAAAVPEPSVAPLVIAALAALMAQSRRYKRTRSMPPLFAAAT